MFSAAIIMRTFTRPAPLRGRGGREGDQGGGDADEQATGGRDMRDSGRRDR
jgi:hypothetical protein